MRKTVGLVATLSQGAVIGGIELSKLLDEMAAEITSKTCLKGLDILISYINIYAGLSNHKSKLRLISPPEWQRFTSFVCQKDAAEFRV